MNIKQAEQATGIPRQNIRFYEKQGLLTPARNRQNDYREYSQSDLSTLKLIRALRLLDMPLDDIAAVLNGTLPLPAAARRQQTRLKAQQSRLEAAIRECGALQSGAPDLDKWLYRMEHQPEEGFCMQWLKDYKTVARAEHERNFTFTPEGSVTNAREFTNALFEYAAQNKLDLVVTRESMYPTFTLNGVEYTAHREYHRMGGGGFSVPVATICCE